ncbi:MAG: DUF177 domain-containing protein [Bacteroidota bacterium]
MEKKSEYSVAFAGLKDGIHAFDYHFDQSFFDSFENALIEQCAIDGQFVLSKKSTLMEGEFKFSGVFHTICDRCGDEMDMKFSGREKLIFKFSHQSESDSDDIVFISPDETELEIAPYFYEFMILNLPSKRVHDEGECDEEVLNLLDEINFQESEEIDPRWEALKKLKKKDFK